MSINGPHFPYFPKQICREFAANENDAILAVMLTHCGDDVLERHRRSVARGNPHHTTRNALVMYVPSPRALPRHPLHRVEHRLDENIAVLIHLNVVELMPMAKHSDKLS